MANDDKTKEVKESSLPKIEMSDDIAILKNQFKNYINVATGIEEDRQKLREALEKKDAEISALNDAIAGAEATMGCSIDKIAAPDRLEFVEMASPVMSNYFSKTAGHDGFRYAERIEFEEQSGYGSYIDGWAKAACVRAMSLQMVGGNYENLPPFRPTNAMIVEVRFEQGPEKKATD